MLVFRVSNAVADPGIDGRGRERAVWGVWGQHLQRGYRGRAPARGLGEVEAWS